MIRPDSKT